MIFENLEAELRGPKTRPNPEFLAFFAVLSCFTVPEGIVASAVKATKLRFPGFRRGFAHEIRSHFWATIPFSFSTDSRHWFSNRRTYRHPSSTPVGGGF